jgi:hypothetical protein
VSLVFLPRALGPNTFVQEGEQFCRGSHEPRSRKGRKTAKKTQKEVGIKRAEADVHSQRRQGTRRFLKETPMNAKVLATMIFALLPNLSLAQSSDQTKSKADPSGNEASQGSAPGKNGNGSDANGAATPSPAESDANPTTAPSSKPLADEVNKTARVDEHVRAARAE